MRRATLLVAMIAGSAWACAAAGQATRPATVTEEWTLTERDSRSGTADVLRRIGWPAPKKGDEGEYDLAKESIVVGVPGNYTGEEAFGVMAFISPGGSGKVPRAFEELLAKHKLIWVAPNGVGNQRAVWVRIGLTLDAVGAVKKKYKIDPERVYVSGVSGGGRVASFMGVCYPDVFSGGLYVVGTDYFKRLATGRVEGEFWPQAYRAPLAKFLNDSKQRVRHVMLNGDGDMNRAQSAAVARQMKADGFRYVTYIEVPGVGHQLPGTEWVEKAIEKLDERPATRPATRPVARSGP